MELRLLAGHTIRGNSQSIALATPEGTLSYIYDAYVYKSCPYIKICAVAQRSTLFLQVLTRGSRRAATTKSSVSPAIPCLRDHGLTLPMENLHPSKFAFAPE
jgi:hypothetical protein